ncbi:MAG TPA: phage holin family protein [Bryobacteraceae bacterium]|jgi:hypothetical protein
MGNLEIRSGPETADNRPLREIVADIVSGLNRIVRDEIRLAIVELKGKLRASPKAVAYLAAAGLLGFLAVECFVTFCIAALAMVLPVWLSALIVALLAASAAGGAFVIGRLALEKIDPIPQQAMEALKDNVDWVRDRLS